MKRVLIVVTVAAIALTIGILSGHEIARHLPDRPAPTWTVRSQTL